MSLYNFGKTLCTVILKPMYRFEISGLEHFPKEGPVILCSNHITNLDPPVVGICAPRQVHFMAKEELFKVPVLGEILLKIGTFPVKRGLSDREALRKGLKVLKDGEVLGLFPEGTRSRTGKLGKGLAGAGFFAARSDASVIPCAIIGPYQKFKPLKVVFGEPIDMTSLRDRKASAEETTLVIMDHIRQLLEKNS
ncbi:lysophospholipid acyltransferase family protein [Metabacillus arenae]|uniref:1-acyl-sn-glycerol-3-phosphate acyltransferase n=1 Tax=Metabacillus arenae TaxID=2771434 RepID=A0A926RVB9_9BACI|nr:lysophospholipid acyltransferase family protein [Metabacillus arenae]MBD1378631.1 1-acyl-sn-glycerol-3-phosphate acyltransferase [Metabacillus arenae]